MNIQQKCMVLCTMYNTENDVEMFQIMVDNKYRAIWEVDNLLGVTEYVYEDTSNDKHYFLRGYYIGDVIPESNKYVLHNFLNITVFVYLVEDNVYQIIKFTINPGK